MIKTPSQDLFDDILKQGIAYIVDVIESRTVENYYLEFKITEEQDYTGKKKLSMPDRKNYAKCISSFGNSEGGVIVWGIKTGKSEADYAKEKKPIQNVSNFVSLLEGFTSILTSPPHPSVSNKVIFENKKKDIGYVITHINKSNRRPFQVINENDFRYYIRAGSSSQPASDIFIRALFGREPQSDTWILYAIGPIKVDEGGVIDVDIGILLHNGGENVSRNINGYVHIAGLPSASLQPNSVSSFEYYTNKVVGLKMGFTAKEHFILGVEQEVQPIIMNIKLMKPIIGNGFQFITLINGDNQATRRFSKEISKKELENAYDGYIKDNKYPLIDALIGGEDDKS